MGVEIPKMAVSLGPYGIPQSDVIEAKVHLGATKEVSSWELLLQNWDNKYSSGGSYPLAVGQDGYICIGRGTNVPQIITTRTESREYEETSAEHYVRVSGRCWGEKLFRRVVTKTYTNQKGEAIVKDLLDYYAGLSHKGDRVDSFSDNYGLWDPKSGTWAIESGEYSGTASTTWTNNPTQGPNFGDVTVTCKIKPIDSISNPGTRNHAPGVLVRYKDENNFVMAYFQQNLDQVSIGQKVGGVWNNFQIIDNAFAWVNGQSYNWKVVVTGQLVQVYVDDVLRSHGTLDASLDAGKVGVDAYNSHSHFDDFYPAYKELVEDTDTTYTKLDYTDSPLWDILKYIAESSDKNGAIGYDFRVAPDGKFEFFPKNSKTSPVDLTDRMEQIKYREDIHRIRNRIKVNGIADKSVPLDKDAWTESLTPTDGVWTATSGSISFDTSKKAKGTGSVKLYAQDLYYGACLFTLNAGKQVNCNLYPIFSFVAFLEKTYNGNVILQLFDTSGREARKNLTIGPNEWRTTELRVGVGNESDWESIQAGFDWTQVKQVKISCDFSGVGTGSFWVDGLYFGGRRYEAVEEDAASIAAYGLRELTETDEELSSDNECDLRAKALLAYLKDPAEYLTVTSSVIDYGNSPLLPADKIYVPFLNADYRIEPVEYKVDAKTQTLEVIVELGKEPPQLADYLYGLRATTVTVEKLARTKLGKRGVPIVSISGGVGAHHVAHEAGDNSGNLWHTVDDGGWDKITGWIAPHFLGPFDDSAAMVQFRTKNKAGTTVLDHQIVPTDDAHGLVGSETKSWKEIHAIYFFFPLSGYVRCQLPGENAQMQLMNDRLEFGSGGAAAPDVYLRRSGSNALEVKAWVFAPAADNVTDLGTGSARFSGLYVSGLGKVGWLNIDNYTVITNARVLQNVTADASIITSGQFGLGRMPRGTSGYVLEAEGAALDPMYVNPNGRYLPAAHQHAAEDITSGGITADVDVAKVGGGTRMLHFVNSKYAGYTDS